jgi:hypothetical protein
MSEQCPICFTKIKVKNGTTHFTYKCPKCSMEFYYSNYYGPLTAFQYYKLHLLKEEPKNGELTVTYPMPTK